MGLFKHLLNSKKIRVSVLSICGMDDSIPEK